MSRVFPITFEVPSNVEPIALVRKFALSLQGCGEPKAGNHYAVPTDLENITAIRTILPKAARIRGERFAGETVFNVALETLVAVNMWCMRAKARGLLGVSRAGYPSVYESVCYKPKVRGVEELWDSVEALTQRGHGVCEDLACMRVAERRMVGDPCRPWLIPQPQKNGVLFHVVVRNADGSIEDPSGVLGMEAGRLGDQTVKRCRIFLAKTSKKCSCPACQAGKSCGCS